MKKEQDDDINDGISLMSIAHPPGLIDKLASYIAHDNPGGFCMVTVNFRVWVLGGKCESNGTDCKC